VVEEEPKKEEKKAGKLHGRSYIGAPRWKVQRPGRWKRMGVIPTKGVRKGGKTF